MTDPISELIRSGNTEPLAELYELIADMVAGTEDVEYEHGVEYSEGTWPDLLVTLFNGCEIALIQFRNQISVRANDGDDSPAVLRGTRGLRK